MIFKRLFTPKYKHDDADIRLSAIEQQAEVTESNKAWLKELAMSDTDVNVRIAALKKLEDTELTLEAFCEAAAQKSETKALYALAISILDTNETQSSGIDDASFVKWITDKRLLPLRSKLVSDVNRLNSFNDIVVDWTLSKSLGNTSGHQVLSLLKRKLSIEVQQRVIEALDDEKHLRKASQFVDTSVSPLIEDKLADIALKKAKPIEVSRAMTMVNSKLLALCELTDYEQIEAERNSLITEFDSIKTDFHYLNQDDAAEISEKYLTIKERVDKRLKALEPQYQLAKMALEYQRTLEGFEEQFVVIHEQVQLLSQSHEPDNITTQIQLLTDSLREMKTSVEQTGQQLDSAPTGVDHVRTRLDKLVRQITSSLAMLENVPATVGENQKAMHLLANYQTLPESTQALQASAEELTRILASIQCHSTLKSVLKERKQAIVATLKRIEKEQKAQEKAVLSKLKAIRGMLQQGKYKAGLSMFSKVKNTLPESTTLSPYLAKIVNEVEESVADLQQWQSFVSNSKTDELVEAAKSLASQTCLDISERADAVKKLRRDWQSVHIANASVDTEKQTQFDEFLEQAFTPCREHFDNEEKQRQTNTRIANEIIDKLNALVSEGLPTSSSENPEINTVEVPKDFIKTWRQLQADFKALNGFERDAKKKLFKTYNAINSDIHQRLETVNEHNAERKRVLVNRAQRLSATENESAAIEEAKKLQAEWKTIGFAGKKHNDLLWNEFRASIDSIFERQRTQRQAEKDEIAKIISQANEQLTSVEKQAEHTSAQSEIEEALATLNDVERSITDSLRNFKSREAKALFKRIEDIRQVFVNINNRQKVVGKEQKLQGLLTQLKEKAGEGHEIRQFCADMTATEEAFYAQIPASQLLVASLYLSDSEQGKQLSVDLDKPTQMRLMAAKLEGKIELSARTAFKAWVKTSTNSEIDESMLDRYESLLLERAGELI